MQRRPKYNVQLFSAMLILSFSLFLLSSCVAYFPRGDETDSGTVTTETTPSPTVDLPLPEPTPPEDDLDGEGFPNPPEDDGTKRY